MKTALESLDKLEALARKIASVRNGANGPVYGNNDGVAAEWEAEAVAIVAELPPVVDRDEVEAKMLVDMACNGLIERRYRIENIASALRRAREEGVK